MCLSTHVCLVFRMSDKVQVPKGQGWTCSEYRTVIFQSPSKVSLLWFHEEKGLIVNIIKVKSEIGHITATGNFKYTHHFNIGIWVYLMTDSPNSYHIKSEHAQFSAAPTIAQYIKYFASLALWSLVRIRDYSFRAPTTIYEEAKCISSSLMKILKLSPC